MSTHESDLSVDLEKLGEKVSVAEMSEQELSPQSSIPDIEEQARRQASFSAVDFARYEERMNTRQSTSTVFNSASSLEKGEEGTPKSLSSAYFASSRSSIFSDITVSTLDDFPNKRYGPTVRRIRHQGFNVYRRLFALVFVLNLAAMLALIAVKRSASRFNLSNIATAAAANIFLAVFIRQDYIVNLLFKTCWLVPHSAPLWLRCRLAKVYEHGGIHSAAGLSGAMWFTMLTALLTIQFVNQTLRSIPILTITYVLLTLFILILVFAYPRFRFMSHNSFEKSHRYAGWASVALFWAEIALMVHYNSTATQQSFGSLLIKEPTFWILIAVTFHIVLPWLRLRKWEFQPEVLSNHALRLNFKHTIPPLSGLAIAESPLAEWHPFATFPNLENSPQGKGGAMIISNAGDWTKRNITEPKTKYWVKGLPKTGVLSMAFVFKRVVVVTTGSGIGPCLSFLREPTRTKTAVRVLWSTPSPLKTYGTDIFDSVLEADRDAVIIDTRTSGRPDLVAITWALYREIQAEAVFVISNPRVTRKVVYAMESRGVPAFGPIWDS